MNELERIENKRRREFSKTRLKKATAKLCEAIKSAYRKQELKHGKPIAIVATAIGLPIGIAMGLLLTREQLAMLENKLEKKSND